MDSLDTIVLFWYESGNIEQGFIPKDVDSFWIGDFLDGGKYTGPITHWAIPNSPSDKQTNKSNYDSLVEIKKRCSDAERTLLKIDSLFNDNHKASLLVHKYFF